VTARAVIAMAAAAALAGQGCGDNLAGGDDLITAVGGTRLALQKYRYDDGTELAATGEFYDTALHVRCTPQGWADGAVRCVPVAEDAEYTDPGCTMAIGISRTIDNPTHFVGHDASTAGRVVNRVFRAGAQVAPITQTWVVVGGGCVGPTAIPQVPTNFFKLDDEVEPSALVEFHAGEVDRGGRLALQLRETDDGARVPFALRDRELGACTAVHRGDGSVVCEPSNAAPAIYFSDPACSQPVMATVAAEPPAIARRIEPTGCASYHRVGREIASATGIYRLDGNSCAPVGTNELGRVFELAGPLELAALDRAPEPAPAGTGDRRLQRVVLDGGGLRFLDDRLLDTANQTECRPRNLRGAIRCVPSSVAVAPLFMVGCTVVLPIAELPARACEPPRYATTSRPFQIQRIGDTVATPAFQLDAGACKPYVAAPGTELRQLTGGIDPATFVEAIYFGEREL
jgi:hypothetical protein